MPPPPPSFASATPPLPGRSAGPPPAPSPARPTDILSSLISAQQADSMASSDTQPEADSLLQRLPELAVPNLSLPSISGWWQNVSEWVGSLVSVERVQPGQEQQ